MNNEIEQINALVQRGLLAATLRPDGHIAFAPTEEAKRVDDAMKARVGVPCNGCGKPYPTPGRLPKYSFCPDCRTGKMPTVDFITRP